MARPKEFDQEKVLDKAMELFWHQGYEATSVQDLVDHMGISRGSLYDTFGGKHALFLAALDRYRSNSYDSFVDLFSQTASIKEVIGKFFSNVVDEAVVDARNRGCFMTNSTVEVAPHDREIASRAMTHRENIENIFRQALAQAQARGEISRETDTRALARFLFNSVQGLRVVGKTTSDRQVLEDIVHVTLSVFD